MATQPTIAAAERMEFRVPLLPENIAIVDGAVDYKGRPIIRTQFGGWRSACFIIVVEIAERISYYGIESNLISYLTGPLGQSTVTAAVNINVWSGISSLLPLLGAVVADSFLGRFRTIFVASLIYILGLGLLTLSVVSTFSNPFSCQNINKSTSCETPPTQMIIFFFSLYLVAIGQSGHKPCVQAFGADQFDSNNPEELKTRSSFFNWWYFGVCGGPLLTTSILSYIQDDISWALGFGIPCITMVIALMLFLLGGPTYRYVVKTEDKSAFLRLGHLFASTARNWRARSMPVNALLEAQGFLPGHASDKFRFLDKALLSNKVAEENGPACTVSEVEEAKSVLRLFPIWATSLAYGIVFAQVTTFFTKQGITMDRLIAPNFTVPAAALQSFISISTVCFIPIYDRIFVPLARRITGEQSGITMLQRIGTGLFISVLCMVTAALVEVKRLKVALEYGLIDLPSSTVPMKVWWQIPQYVLMGISNLFIMVGLQEFFYDQVPTDLRSVGLALYLSIFGIGSLLSSFMVFVIEKETGGRDGQDGWFSDNLNKAHLDYFYWLLAGLCAVGLSIFMCAARSYIYNRKSAHI